jgi:hypothetical protein
MKEEKVGFIFSKENAVMQIATTALITSWIILFVYVASFVASILPLLNGSVPWSQLVGQFSTILNIVYPLIMGVVYFSILQGIARLLHLGLDIFYVLEPDDEEDEEEVIS